MLSKTINYILARPPLHTCCLAPHLSNVQRRLDRAADWVARQLPDYTDFVRSIIGDMYECWNRLYSLTLTLVFVLHSVLFVNKRGRLFIISNSLNCFCLKNFTKKYKVHTFSFSLISHFGELWTYFHCYHKNGNNVNHCQ